MSDQNSDQSLAGEEQAETSLPAALVAAPSAADVITQVLDIDHALSMARGVERTAYVCLRADLEADLFDALKELGTLVDDQGNVLEPVDASLGESNAARANELNEKVQQLNRDMLAETFFIRFRGMDSDAWDAFEKANRTSDGKAKPNIVEYGNKLVAETAIAPTMTTAQVAALRKKLGHEQIKALVETAFSACTKGGLDIPKLPSFLVDPKPLPL